MIRPAIALRLLALSWLWAGIVAESAAAETLRLRSGEHEGFTRLVVDLGAASGWELGRTETGYELRLVRDDVEFDLSGVYRLIRRDRLGSVTAGGAPGRLALSVPCDCHATAFVTGSGALVIDIADGPAPEGSAFERRLEEAATTAEVAEEPPAPPADGASERLSLWQVPQTGYRPPPTTDPRLALFWRGTELPPEPDRTGTEEAPQAAPLPEPRHAGLPVPEAPDPAGAASSNAEEDLLLPPVPDPRVTEAQTDLLHQLSRAAAQGLVEVNRPSQPRVAEETAHPETAMAEPPATAGHTGLQQSSIHAETSIDRDTLSTVTRAPVTAEGGLCLPDSDFDLVHWGDDRPPTIQIADRRAPLVGEFDRPSDDAVLALARLYLFLGFGAEARAVLDSFAVESADATVLREMSLILDGGTPGAGAAIAGMTGCDTAAALWAVLAWPDLPPGADVDEEAVLRAYSALPVHLRRSLGPELSDRFLSVGDEAAAHAVRDAIARAPGDPGAALSMVEAQIDLAAGRAEEGERVLDPLARRNDPLSVDALIMAVQSRLARGQAVETDLADSAAALAFELQDGPRGPVLNQLHVLARGSGQDFDRAFEAYRHWAGEAPETVRADTVRRLFAMLDEPETEESAFLLQYFRNRDILEAANPDLLLRLDLAERLTDSGFAGEARRLLKGEAGYTDRGRRLLARAALGEFDPAEAQEQLAGLDDREAGELRAAAAAMAGNHVAAAARYSGIGEAEKAGREAWRGGNWAVVAESGPEPMRSALEAFGVLPANAPAQEADTAPEAPAGPLAESRSLIEASRSVRTALDALLAATDSGG